MIKDCTTIGQGRELMELGISPSTADKCWIAIESGKDEPALYGGRIPGNGEAPAPVL